MSHAENAEYAEGEQWFGKSEDYGATESVFSRFLIIVDSSLRALRLCVRPSYSDIRSREIGAHDCRYANCHLLRAAKHAAEAVFVLRRVCRRVRVSGNC